MDHSDRSQSPRTTSSGKHKHTKLKAKENTFSFCRKSSFPSSPKADPEKPCTQSYPQSPRARKRPHCSVCSLTSVALVSPSAAVSVRSLSVCGSQRQSDPRRKQGQKTNPSGQTGHTLVEPFKRSPWGLGYPTFPREYGHEQSKAEAELGVFSRAPSEAKTRGTRTVGHPDLFAFPVRNTNLSPHPFPPMPLKALLKNV